MGKTTSEKAVRNFLKRRPDAHIFKIDKFSLVEKYRIKICMSSLFSMNNYRWRLTVYPRGDEKQGGKGYVSVYLAIEDPRCMPSDSRWQVNVKLNLVLINQKDLCDQTDQGPQIKRFNAAEMVWGNAKFISQKKFKDETEGFLVDDCCLFAAEVVGGKRASPPECLTFIEKPLNFKVTWKITKLSTFKEAYHYSDEFTVGPRNWRIKIRPQGSLSGEGNSLSAYLNACYYVDDDAPKARTFVRHRLRVLDQLYGKHVEKERAAWFDEDGASFGVSELMPLEDLYDKSKGFLVNDMLYVGVEFDVISETKYF